MMRYRSDSILLGLNRRPYESQSASLSFAAVQNVLIKIRFRCIKKDHSLSIFLENERSFTFLLFCWMIKILLFLWCVSEAAVQYHRHVYSIRNCLFVCFSVTLIKPEKPLKVPKIKDFYKSARCSATIVSSVLSLSQSTPNTFLPFIYIGNLNRRPFNILPSFCSSS